MYFAEPGADDINPPNPILPRVSQIALRYATREGVTGVVVRGVLKRDAKTAGLEDLRDDFRSDENRLARAGIGDLGVYAASLGLDAFSVDEAFDYARERTWVVVNRTALILQVTATQVAAAVPSTN